MAGLLAFTLTVDWQAHRVSPAALKSKREELARIVEIRQGRAAELERRLNELRAQADSVAKNSSAADVRTARLLADQIAAIAGIERVEGRGVLVALRDATSGQGTSGDDFRIQDVDVQAVVNALWNAGAEAIAVNEQRLVSTSAIRNAGAAILVNYRVLVSPYRIAAIGDSAKMESAFASSPVARRFRAWESIYGLGFAVAKQDHLIIPAFGGSLRFRYVGNT